MNFGDARLPERFWAKVSPEPNSGCWLWTAARNRGGYGVFATGSELDRSDRMSLSHRVAFEAITPIRGSLQLDHLCRVRCCVNPAHLEAVTQQENLRRGDSGANMRSRTHCPKGHPYQGDNLVLNQEKQGWQHRRCRICKNEQSKLNLRRYRAAAKADRIAMEADR